MNLTKKLISVDIFTGKTILSWKKWHGGIVF